MTVAAVQRWRDRRESYRPAGEPIRTADYDVATFDDDNTPKAFVVAHHYSGTFPAARFRFGLYRHGQLVGVAVFSHPANNAVITNELPGKATDGAVLGRLVLLDDVPANGETWFLGRCFAELRHELVGVVSDSDPFPLTTAEGRVVMPGHVGTIYQAFNGVYRGLTRRRPIWVLPDGRGFNERALSKIQTRSKGWRYSAAQLERAGAAPLGERDDARAWLALWLPRVTRKFTHPGKHRYAWAFDRAARRHLVSAGRYPKKGLPS